ncbi:MAG: hypothetical protein VB934_03920 [Polyangiaceae bacterium]
MDLGQRAERLATELIAPLLTGGTVKLQYPFGSALCGQIGPHRQIVDAELRHTVAEARLQAARKLLPTDSLPELDAAEWTLAAALNDLLQITNHELSGFATRGYHEQLGDQIRHVAKNVSPVSNLGEAIARYATFSRVFELVRHDTTVSWWTGHKQFRGQPASRRLLLWKNVRNVTTVKAQVDFQSLVNDLPYVDGELYSNAAGCWIGCSPLTDLANAHRALPAFVWTPAAISVIATLDGHNLALRAIQHDATNIRELPRLLYDAADASLGAAGRNIAQSFAKDLRAAVEQWFPQPTTSGRASDSQPVSP